MDAGVLRRVVDELVAKPHLAGYIVPESTPVFSFGDVRKARVATLGINPSLFEFLDSQKDGELTGMRRRLQTLSSLGVASYENLTGGDIEKISNSCNLYFYNNPYWHWFEQLEDTVLKPLRASYCNGTACHLDLFPWATDPTWGGIEDKAMKNDLIELGKNLLRNQLKHENVEILLLNGKTATDSFFDSFVDGGRKCGGEIYGFKVNVEYGHYEHILVIGCRVYIQKVYYKAKRRFKKAYAEKVAKIVLAEKPDFFRFFSGDICRDRCGR